MASEEIDALRRETDAGAPEQGQPQSPPVDDVPADDAAKVDAILPIVMQAVETIGAAMCERARVAPLEKPEVLGLSMALARLFVLYDFGNMDPKTAAWLGLGIMSTTIVLPRLKKPIEAKSVPADAAANAT